MNVSPASNQDIFSNLARECIKESETISLIPSENVMSELATRMYMTRSNNRYILPLKIGNEYFMPGRESLEKIEKILSEKLCATYKQKHVITRGLSGLHQMDIIMSALRKKADKLSF